MNSAAVNAIFAAYHPGRRAIKPAALTRFDNCA
jgi:hypothetical protein